MMRTFARWQTLGTYAFLATEDLTDLDRAETVARDVLAEVDRTCSRFRADSDLVRANNRAGRWVEVDPLLVAATEVALQAARETDGLVDPCLGLSLVSLGYDRDIDDVRRRPTYSRLSPLHPRPGAWREVGVDPAGAIRVPVGVALDLGATAKAWASDLVARTIVETLECHLVVSLGGDVRIDGPDTPHPGWPVLVTERPDDTEGGEIVHLGGGGLATSSTQTRRWRTGDVVHHHLLDPRTGWPVEETWRTATATGPTCVAANTASTAALVLGEAAPEWLRHRSVTGRLVARSGQVVRLGSWPDPAGAHAFPPVAEQGRRR